MEVRSRAQEYSSRQSYDSGQRVSPLPVTHSLNSLQQKVRVKSPSTRIFDLEGMRPEYVASLNDPMRGSTTAQRDNHELLRTIQRLQEENVALKSQLLGLQHPSEKERELLQTITRLHEANTQLKDRIEQVEESQLQQSILIKSGVAESQVHSEGVLRRKIELYQRDREQQDTQIHQLTAEVQSQKDIIDMQYIKIDGLNLEKQSAEKTLESYKAMLQHKDQHIESLLTKLKRMQEQHQQELMQLHRDGEAMQNTLYESINEKVHLYSQVNDAKNQAQYHQSFADKHLAKSKESEQRHIEEVSNLKEQIDRLEREVSDLRQY